MTAIDEYEIPRVRITNGPVGVGTGDGTPSPPATSPPMTIGLAAGFDPTSRTPTVTTLVRRRQRWASTCWKVPGADRGRGEGDSKGDLEGRRDVEWYGRALDQMI